MKNISDLIREMQYDNPKHPEFKQTAQNLKTATLTDHDTDKPTDNSKDDVTTTKVPDQIHKDALKTEGDVSPISAILAGAFAAKKVM
jgi:hypothetical protein